MTQTRYTSYSPVRRTVGNSETYENPTWNQIQDIAGARTRNFQTAPRQCYRLLIERLCALRHDDAYCIVLLDGTTVL